MKRKGFFYRYGLRVFLETRYLHEAIAITQDLVELSYEE